MSREEIYKKLNTVFQEIFDNEDIKVNDSTTAKDIKLWDSLMHVTLIAEIENAFNIRFLMNDIPKMNTVGDMVDKIMELI